MGAKKKLSRRDFIKAGTRLALWGAGALGLGMLIRFFSFEPEEGTVKSHDLGLPEELPDEPILVYPEIPAVLIRQGLEFRALSLRCTHLGCTLDYQDDGLLCPCHGSVFSVSGAVTKGPAVKNLPELKIEINEVGHLIIQAEGDGR